MVSRSICVRRVSALKRGSWEQLTRNRSMPCRFEVCAGAPITRCGRSLVSVRHVPTWQIAQLFAMRSNPIVFFENPTG